MCVLFVYCSIGLYFMTCFVDVQHKRATSQQHNTSDSEPEAVCQWDHVIHMCHYGWWNDDVYCLCMTGLCF